MKSPAIALAVLLVGGATLPAQAGPAPTGTALKTDELKAEPFRDARTTGNLAAGDKVDILKQEGGWIQVKSAKGSGWVRMLSIRRGGGAGAGAASADVAGLSKLASGRAGTGRVVATTGVRGLNEEELKSAKFSETEIKLAESFTTSRPNAQKFATQGKLVVQKLEYLPDASSGGTGQTGELR